MFCATTGVIFGDTNFFLRAIFFSQIVYPTRPLDEMAAAVVKLVFNWCLTDRIIVHLDLLPDR